MKKIFPHFWSYMLAFILFSCQTPDTNSIDLSRPAGTIIQKLSDMADNLRAIPLETNDSCLLSDYIKIWVGNKYIVTADKNAIHLFGKDGKHIRQLASQGKGPGEFSSIATFTVDESNERLYYRDWNQRTSRSHSSENRGKYGKNSGYPQRHLKPVTYRQPYIIMQHILRHRKNGRKKI